MYSEVAKQFHWVGEVIWSILQAHRDHSTNLGNNDCNLKQKALLSLSSDGSDIVWVVFYFNSNPIPSSVNYNFYTNYMEPWLEQKIRISSYCINDSEVLRYEFYEKIICFFHPGQRSRYSVLGFDRRTRGWVCSHPEHLISFNHARVFCHISRIFTTQGN